MGEVPLGLEEVCQTSQELKAPQVQPPVLEATPDPPLRRLTKQLAQILDAEIFTVSRQSNVFVFFYFKILVHRCCKDFSKLYQFFFFAHAFNLLVINSRKFLWIFF